MSIHGAGAVPEAAAVAVAVAVSGAGAEAGTLFKDATHAIKHSRSTAAHPRDAPQNHGRVRCLRLLVSLAGTDQGGVGDCIGPHALLHRRR